MWVIHIQADVKTIWLTNILILTNQKFIFEYLRFN